MQLIPLQAIPKQNLTISLDGGVLYEIDMLLAGGIMAANVTRAGTLIASGQRCVAGQLVLNYFTQEDGQGNFLFLTQNDELPTYVEFGINQFLIYASDVELAAVRASPQIIFALLQTVSAMHGAATMQAGGAHH